MARPFEGLAGETEWIALRELVPSATAPLRLADPAYADRGVTLATVLPLALPAIVRTDGRILIGLQVHSRSGDASRDLAHALEQALEAEPGTMLPASGLPGPGPRLQDLLDPTVPLVPTLHADFGFWLDGLDDGDGDGDAGEGGGVRSAEVQASLERANNAIVPTTRLSTLDAAYWCQVADKTHLRWVAPYGEDELLDALARLGAVRQLGLGEGTKYAGSFRAHGRLVPVWDLPGDEPAEHWDEPVAAFDERLTAALAVDGPLSDAERRTRDGLRGRQLTLR